MAERAGTVQDMLANLVDTMLERAHTGAELVDRLPVMPANLADKAMRTFLNWQDRVASRDPVWRHLRANNHDKGYVTWEDSKAMRRIENALTPEPAWVEWTRHARTWTLARAIWRVRMGAQLAQRGWCEEDAWNLDHVLCRRLAAQLDNLAEQAHGWPCSEEFPAFEDWTRALRQQAANLRRVDGSPDAESLLNIWSAMEESGDGRVENTWNALNTVEANDIAAVTEALEWVAAHHQSLWD